MCLLLLMPWLLNIWLSGERSVRGGLLFSGKWPFSLSLSEPNDRLD